MTFPKICMFLSLGHWRKERNNV